eukprot:2503102-Amphidinium_carterae.1
MECDDRKRIRAALEQGLDPLSSASESSSSGGPLGTPRPRPRRSRKARLPPVQQLRNGCCYSLSDQREFTTSLDELGVPARQNPA